MDQEIKLTKRELAEAWDEIVGGSPHYGTGYARYSLLFDRFAETLGFGRNPDLPQMPDWMKGN